MKLDFKNIKDKFSLANLKRVFKKTTLVVIEKIDWIFFFLLVLDIALGIFVFYKFTFLIQSQKAGEIVSLEIQKQDLSLVIQTLERREQEKQLAGDKEHPDLFRLRFQMETTEEGPELTEE